MQLFCAGYPAGYVCGWSIAIVLVFSYLYVILSININIIPYMTHYFIS